MRRDAEANAEADKTRREEVETRNEADNTVYRTEKFLKENGDKLGDKKAGIETAIQAAKDALKGSDVKAIQGTLEKINELMQAASTEMYAKAGAQAGPGEPEASAAAGAETAQGKPGAKKGDDGPVIDADVVDDKKA